MMEFFEVLGRQENNSRIKKSAGVLDNQHYNADPSAKHNDGLMNFPAMVAEGEGLIPNDAVVHTPNGVAHSKGRGHNSRIRWCNNDAPQWNNNQPWAENGNRTGE